MIPWVIAKDPTDFSQMVDSLHEQARGENLPDGWVPDSTYWLVDKRKKVIGVANIRHALTEKLLYEGGHIGYGIRPSERRKGFAVKLLALSLEKAKELGIDRALVVCDDTNVGSKKTILRNGGIRDDDHIEEDGNVVNRFWIDLI